MTQKAILSLLAKLVLDSKMFCKVDGFSDSAETPLRRDIRAIMYHNYRQRKSFQQYFHSLSHCFGDYSPSWSTVQKGYKELHFSRTTFQDSDRCGQPLTVATEQNVAKVKCPIKEDQWITENEIKVSCMLSSGNFNWILRHHLGVWKRSARWVPYQLTEEQRKGRVDWCLQCFRIWQRRVRAGLGHCHG